MAKMKTSELAGQALVWAMAMATDTPANAILVDGKPEVWSPDDVDKTPTLDRDGKPRFLLHGTVPCGLFGSPIEFGWGSFGPLLEEEGICLLDPCSNQNRNGQWHAHCGAWGADGETALIAAARSLVASRLGLEVEVPEVLLP